MTGGQVSQVPGAPQSGFSQMRATCDGLRIQLLGGFEVRAAERLLVDESFNHARTKSLVKLLAVQKRRSLHREQVVETLWPGASPGAADNNLRQNLHHLRVAFAAHGCAPPIVAKRDAVDLAPHVSTDVEDFRIAAAAAHKSRTGEDLYTKAIELYAGDLLPGDPYEEWCIAPRSELRETYLLLLSELAALCQSNGRGEDAADLFRRVLEQDPLREGAHRSLMRLYADGGDHGRSVRQYMTVRDALRRELGVSPSDETEALYRQIVDGHLEGVPPAGAAGRGVARVRSPRSEIRHATTRDGVRIAYSVCGEGEPLVMIPTFPSSHLLVEWETPDIRHFIELLAQERRIIRYDTRGNGVTGGDVPEYTLDGLVADLDAVVDDLGLERFPLYASFNAGPVATSYAARHPGRVSRLFAWSCYARGADFFEQPPIRALEAVHERDWEQYCQAMGNALNGWVAGDSANQLVNLIKAGSPPEVVGAFMRDGRKFDVSGLLPLVTCPTLVVHRRDELILGDIVRRLAADIPRSRLLFVDRTAAVPWSEKAEEVAGIILGFLREESAPGAAPSTDGRRSS